MTTHDYNALLGELFEQLDIPDSERGFRPGRLVLERQRLTKIADVKEALETFNGATGWVETTDSLQPWSGSVPDGVPLNAELSDGERGLTLRRGAREWILVRSHVEDTEHGGELLQEVSYRSRKGFPTLTYLVGWRIDEDDTNRALAPHACHPHFGREASPEEV